MKWIFQFSLFILHFSSIAQPIVHKGVFYRDDESVNSDFLANKVSEIQSQLNYLKENGVHVNVLLMAKECPDLTIDTLDGGIYFNGPKHTNNGEESSLWGKIDNKSYTFQFLPRQAKLYYQTSQGNSFWSSAGVDFDYPLLLDNDKYYCAIKKSLNNLCAIKGLNLSNPTVDCENGDPAAVENAIQILPQSYLKRSEVDFQSLKANQIVAKTNFCTNLFFYGPYLHTRSTEDDLREVLVNSVEEGFVLITVVPDDGSNSAIFKDVLLDISNGEGYPDNCYPTSRELSEQDRLAVLHKLHGGNISGASSNLQNVKSGSEYLLERLLGAAQTPVPGNTNCEYGYYGGGNGFTPGNYNYVPDPIFQFYGPVLPTPGSNGHVKWYNSFDGIPGGVVGGCTEAASAAQEHGLNLQFCIASGCTPNTSQFGTSRAAFEQTNPAGASAVMWMYYDECDHRLYYDVKLPNGFTANINAGYGISNPDSIAALRISVEKIVKGILEEVSRMPYYQNADLDEGEYPENMHNEALSIFFGEGTSCEGESPWTFGIRDGHSFGVPELTGECLTILWEIITDQSIPQRLWHPKPPAPCMLDMPGAAAGIIDGCLNLVNGKVWNLTGLLSAAVDFYKADAGTRKAVLKSISNPLNLILGQYPQNFQCISNAECQEERVYCFTNLSTNAIFDIFGKAIVSVVGNVANVGAVVDDKLKMFVPNFDDTYNVWKRTLSEGAQQKVHIFMENISESSKFKMAKRVTLNKIWQKFDAGQLPGVTKEQLQVFFERLPEHDQQDFYNKFDEIFINDAGEIADPSKVNNFIEDVNGVEPAKFVDIFNEAPEQYFRAWDISNAAGNVHLRKNTGFLETVNEFLDGTISQKYQAHGCTLVEEAVIRHYTDDYYSLLNLALVGDIPITDEFLEFKNTLNQGLHKLPNHTGVVYRGLGDFESLLADNWVVGQTVENASWDKKFLSTSMERGEAEKFRLKGGGHVIVKIEPSLTGKNIAEVSAYPTEAEILYPTGKQYRVLDIMERADDSSVLEITIKEI